MKKKTSCLTKRFSASILYLDDLEEIVSILRKSTEEITIICGEYEYESLDELVKHLNADKCQGLEISTNSPYVHIEINRQAIDKNGNYIDNSLGGGDVEQNQWVEKVCSNCQLLENIELGSQVYNSHKNVLYVGSDNREGKIIYYEICEVLLKKIRLLSHVFNKYFLWFVFTTLCILAPLAGLIKKHPVFSQAGLAIPITLLMLILVSFYFVFGPATKIYLKRRSERSNFFVRKKDDLLLLVVGATIGAVITVVVQKLLEHM
jgi:hypothetical protein